MFNSHNTVLFRRKILSGITLIFLTLQLPVYSQTVAGDECTISESDLDTAGEVVARLHNTLITVMKDAENLGYHGRYEILEPVITENFNTPLITRTILGHRYWDSLTQTQQQEFIELFLQLSIATYADRFDAYDGESFVETERKSLPLRGVCPPPSGRQAPAKRIIIKTELIRENEDPVKLEYLQQQIDGKWYIITVIADGVNDLSLKRGEYTDVIKQRGFEGLIEELTIKIRDMENGTEEGL